MRVLVTGSAGFIGRATCWELFRRGHTVISKLDRQPDATRELGGNAVQGDIRERDALEQAFAYKPDAVIHLAAQTSLQASLDNPEMDAATNVGGTLAVIDAALRHNCRRMVFASTSAVYRPSESGEYDPDDVCDPIVPYGISKLAAEHYIKQLMPEWVILRYGNVYGPGQRPLGENILIARALEHLGQGAAFLVNGNGEQVRDWVYVDDVAQANVRALEEGTGEVHNVGGETASVNEVLLRLAQSWVRLAERANLSQTFDGWKNGPAKPGELRHVDLVGITFRGPTRLQEGLERTVRAYLRDLPAST